MTVAIIRCILCRTPWTTATSTCWIEVLHHKCRQSVAFFSRCSIYLLILFCLINYTHLSICIEPCRSHCFVCSYMFCLHSVCWLSLLDYLTCTSSQDEGNIDWNALMAIMLVCLPHHGCSVSVIQELSPHVLITSAKQEQCLLEFIEKLGKLSHLNHYFKWSAQIISWLFSSFYETCV